MRFSNSTLNPVPCPVKHPALPSLFDPDIPDHPVLWSVLEGRHAGRALVDNLDQPSQCLLRTNALLTFASRQISPGFLEQACRMLASDQLSLVWPGDPSDLPQTFTRSQSVNRIAYADCDPSNDLLFEWRTRLPFGCQLRFIDCELLNRCEWREDMIHFCGSLENFLANDLGLCLMSDNEIITEAYASSFGRTHAEIGAITRTAMRGRGYAPIACSYLIQALVNRGYLPY